MSLTHPHGPETEAGPPAEDVRVAQPIKADEQYDDRLPPNTPNRRGRMWMGVGGAALAFVGGVYALRGGGDSEPVEADGTELSIDANPASSMDFDFNSFEGDRELTPGEVDSVISGYGFTPEIAEGFTSKSLAEIRYTQSVLDETLGGGIVPFVENGNLLIFDSWYINGETGDDREVYLFIEGDGNNLFGLDGAALPDAGTYSEALTRAGVPLSTEVTGQPDTEDLSTGEVTATGQEFTAPPADLSPQELLALPIEQTMLLQPAERSDLARAAYEQATGEPAISSIVMPADQHPDFYFAKVDRIFNAAASTGDPRILWSIYSGLDNPQYLAISQGLASGDTAALLEAQISIADSTDYIVNPATSTGSVTVNGDDIEIRFNGDFWQFG